MMEKLSKELDFPYQKNGSLVVCTNEKKWKGYMNYWREAGETEWRSCRFLTELH